MKITKQVLKEMIKTELSSLKEEISRTDENMAKKMKRKALAMRKASLLKKLTAAEDADMHKTDPKKYAKIEAAYNKAVNAWQATGFRAQVQAASDAGSKTTLEEDSVESETHRNRVKQASGVLSSKMETLVDEAFFLADELDMDRMQTRLLFKEAAKELQNFQSNSNNPVTQLVINKLKFLMQPGVLIDEIGDAIIALDENTIEEADSTSIKKQLRDLESKYNKTEADYVRMDNLERQLKRLLGKRTGGSKGTSYNPYDYEE